ncbi:MAG: hypothetical protein VXW57_00635, partial [Pseudomonadota bacterium]|nr:hypothetical protein [Pseudomonadota bacterium]
ALALGGWILESNEINDAYEITLAGLQDAEAWEAAEAAAESSLAGEIGSARYSVSTKTENSKGKQAMFGFDTGGSSGPWLVWSAKGTEDGQIGPRSFYIREGSGANATKTPTDGPSKGMLMDIHSLKTGWQEPGGGPGVAPKWVWGESPSKLPAYPGDGYKKGFSMKIALPGGQVVLWEQAGAGAWNAFANLVPSIGAGPHSDFNQLPLVRMVGAEKLTFTTGGTVVPTLEIAKWMPRPASLAGGGSGGIDTGGAAPAAAKPAAAKPAAAPAPAPEMADDEIEF